MSGTPEQNSGTAERDRNIAEDLRNGLQPRQVAEKYGIGIGTVYRARDRAEAEQGGTSAEHEAEHARAEQERNTPEQRSAQDNSAAEHSSGTRRNTVKTPAEHFDAEHLTAEERMARAKEVLTEALWMKDPQRYTELRLELLGANGTVLPPGTGAFGMSSSLTERAQTALNK